LSEKSSQKQSEESDYLGKVYEAIFSNHYLKPILANVFPEEIEKEEIMILRI